MKQEEGFAAGAQAGLVVLHKVSDAIRALLPLWISPHEKDSINAEAFLIREHGMAGVYGGPQSGSARAGREAYMNPLISPSVIIFQSSFVASSKQRIS